MVDNSEEECLRLIKLKDYYEILGIPKTALEEEIRKAYKKLAIKFHPDKNKAKNAEEAFKKINQAFSVLGTKEKKQRYDMFGTDEDVGMSSGRENFDPFDIFNMFFNEFNQGGRAGMRSSQSGPGSAQFSFNNGNVSYTVYSSSGGLGGGFPNFGSFGFSQGNDEDEDDNDIFSQLFNMHRGGEGNNQRKRNNNNSGDSNSDPRNNNSNTRNERKKQQAQIQANMQRLTMFIQMIPLICCFVFFIFPILLKFIL